MLQTAEARDAAKAKAERLVKSAERALRKASSQFTLAGCPAFSARTLTMARLVMNYDDPNTSGGAL